MGYTVFVSHASQDKDVAEKIAQFLEQQGIDCWMAPRDVRPGHEYAAEIVRGIAACPVMVLVLSEHANHSVFVKREIERGVSQGKTVFPIRVREVLPSQSLELFISSHHWIDAWKPPLEQYLGRLVEAIQVVVSGDGGADMPPGRPRPLPHGGHKPGRPRINVKYLIGGIAAAAAIVAVTLGVQRLSPVFLGHEGATSNQRAESSSAVRAGDLVSSAPSASHAEQTEGPLLPTPPASNAEQTGDPEETAPESKGEIPEDSPTAVERSGDGGGDSSSADSLPIGQIMLALEEETGSRRYRTIQTLADVMPAELTTDQLLAIVESSAYRLNAIGLLKDRLPDTLAYDDVMKLVDPVKGSQRYNTIKLFADRMPGTLTVDQMLAIVESSAYRLNAIGLVNDRLPRPLTYDDAMKIVDPVKGSERYNTIKLLADRITDELTAEQIETVIESSSYLNDARILLRQSPDRT